MSNLHFQKKQPPEKRTGKGFYITLGVCLIAIGVAAWTTYDSVVQYVDPSPSSSQTAEPTQQTVSGVAINSLPSSEPESSEPETSSAAVSSEEESSSEPAEPTAVVPVSSQTPEEPTEFLLPFANTKVLKAYSEKPVYSQTMKDWRTHNGIDLSAAAGDTVKSITSGTVEEIKKDPLYGNMVVIRHGSITARYCGLGDTALVKQGDTVTAGQDIGSISSVPCESTEASHLHLILEKDEKEIDPTTILDIS